MINWFMRMFPQKLGSYFFSPALIFCLGDLIVGTFFQLAFGRYGLKLSTRVVERKRGRK